MSLIEGSRRPLDLRGQPAPTDAAEEEAASIDFTVQQQCHSNWCWAAVAASVVEYYDPASGTAQCEVANRDLRREDCCAAECGDGNVDFNVTNVLASPLNRFHCFERLKRMRRAAPDEVLTEMTAGRPLCVRSVWAGGGAHFLVVVGYRRRGENDPVLSLADPYWGYSEYTYSRFSKHYQLTGGEWTDTYFTRAPFVQKGASATV
jgi:hypothetical protein